MSLTEKKRRNDLKKLAYKLGILALLLLTAIFIIFTYVVASDSKEAAHAAISTFFAHVTATVVIMLLGLMGLSKYEKLKEIDDMEALADVVYERISDNGLSDVNELLSHYRALQKSIDFTHPDNPIARNHYWGLTAIHRCFGLKDFIERAEKGNDVDILNTWIPDWTLLEPVLLKCIRNRKIVNLLILNHLDPHTKVREETIDIPGLSVEAQIKTTYANVKHLYDRLNQDERQRLRFRTYSGHAPFCMYRVGDVVTVGVFPVQDYSINSLSFEFPFDSDLAKSVRHQFLMMWHSRGKDIDLSLAIDTFGR